MSELNLILICVLIVVWLETRIEIYTIHRLVAQLASHCTTCAKVHPGVFTGITDVPRSQLKLRGVKR